MTPQHDAGAAAAVGDAQAQDAPRGCAGVAQRARTAALCLVCMRLGRPGLQVPALARRSDNGVWSCVGFVGSGAGGAC